MQTPNSDPKQTKPANKKTIAALVGTLAAGILLAYVPAKEGTIYFGHLDPIGIATKCSGDTNNVVLGKSYTKAECEESLNRQLVIHAEGVLKCTPILRNYPYQLAAAVTFAYNLGVGAYCKSSIARAFNAGDFKTACVRFNRNALGKPQYIYAGKMRVPDGNGGYKLVPKPWKGLIIRRAEERKMCETNLPNNVGTKP